VSGQNDAFNVLRRFARRRESEEVCEFCSQGLATHHQHLVEPPTRRLICVCDACAILFPGGQTKYKRVPRALRYLPDFRITDAQWDSLLIPIEMAFFYDSSEAGRVVALYPSPAGPTESALTLEAWQEIVRDNAVLAGMEQDVEALVVNRLGTGSHPGPPGGRTPEYYILPIDECFKLVGLIRLHWKGFSGGAEVWEQIDRFFADVQSRAVPVREVARA
jgi:hypothetical protein